MTSKERKKDILVSQAEKDIGNVTPISGALSSFEQMEREMMERMFNRLEQGWMRPLSWGRRLFRDSSGKENVQQMWQYDMDKIYPVYGDEPRALWIKNTHPANCGTKIRSISIRFNT